jgi:hypothetical protein
VISTRSWLVDRYRHFFIDLGRLRHKLSKSGKYENTCFSQQSELVLLVIYVQQKKTKENTMNQIYLMLIAQALLIIAAPIVAYKLGMLRGKKSVTA